MYLGPADELDGHRRPGIVTVPIACASEGSLEVFMEPVLPQPHVVVVGSSPAVRTLAGLAAVLDWRVTVVGDIDDAPQGATVRTVEQWDEIGVDQYTPIVVATQGHFDEPALEAALASSAPYIGLVASSRRADTVLGYLADRGHDQASLDRIETPAGLDLGEIQHREIAVAVLARIVELRASGAIAGAKTETASPTESLDPVCGMTVNVETAMYSSEHAGTTTYFCCAGCKAQFEQEPSAFKA